MGNFWLKIKIWTKGITFGAISLYALIFFLKNDVSVTVWYFPWKDKYEISLIWLTMIAFVTGGLVLFIIRTTFTTLRQIRDLRQRNRIERLERDQAQLKAKAAMLQTRTSAPAQPVPTPAAAPVKESVTDED